MDDTLITKSSNFCFNSVNIKCKMATATDAEIK